MIINSTMPVLGSRNADTQDNLLLQGAGSSGLHADECLGKGSGGITGSRGQEGVGGFQEQLSLNQEGGGNWEPRSFGRTFQADEHCAPGKRQDVVTWPESIRGALGWQNRPWLLTTWWLFPTGLKTIKDRICLAFKKSWFFTNKFSQKCFGLKAWSSAYGTSKAEGTFRRWYLVEEHRPLGNVSLKEILEPSPLVSLLQDPGSHKVSKFLPCVPCYAPYQPTSFPEAMAQATMD